MKDEDNRLKLMLKLKDILEQPQEAPELHDPNLVEEERAFIEEVEKKSKQGGEKLKENILKGYRYKYEKYWEKSHAAKLSEIKKYDLTPFRYKDINKNPQNILVFGGKLLQYLQKRDGFSTNTNDNVQLQKN